MNKNQKKILYIASTEIHICSFHLPYLKWLRSQNYEVHVAYNGKKSIQYSDVIWTIPFGRSPFDKKNINAYNILKNIVKSNHFDLIHCHTPMASFITRLASRFSRKNGTQVLYTAHGFHFFKKGPIKNWLLYFPVEWFLSYYTDGIITINKEDFRVLHEKYFLSKKRYLINGIGINPERLAASYNTNISCNELKINYIENEILVLYIAEFIDRKNHKFIINSLPRIIEKCPKIKFLFAGGGVLRDKMIKLANKKGVQNHVVFLGFRQDIGNYISISDIGISASKQEGLGLGIAEMMYHNLPVVVSKDRGHNEMVRDGENGLMFNQNDQLSFINNIVMLYHNSTLRKELGEKGKISINKFMVDESLDQMIKIYKYHLKSNIKEGII